jgi:sarcosine oxidase, subunit gamma
MEATKHSPVHEEIAHLKPEWETINSMPVALGFGNGAKEAALREELAVCDLSYLNRFGVKGKNAAEWLREQAVETPDSSNTWTSLPNGGLTARLGRSEFLIEDGPEGSKAEELKSSSNLGSGGVYPVLRQDAAFALTGRRAREVVSQVCGLDFDSVDYDERPVFFTRVAVTSALVLPRMERGVPVFRIWCGYPYGVYLWEELYEIVVEYGGGPIGVSAFYGGDESE